MKRALFVAVWFACVVAVALSVRGLRFDSDSWLAPQHPLEKQLDYVADEFEAGESLLLISSVPEHFFSDASLFPRIAYLEERLTAIAGVISVRSPLSAKTITKNDGGVDVHSFHHAFTSGAIASTQQLRRAFHQSPYQGKLLSADGKTFALQMRLDTRNNASQRERVVREIKKEAKQIQDAQFQLTQTQNAPTAGDAADEVDDVTSDVTSDVDRANIQKYGPTQFAGDAALKHAINRTVQNELWYLLIIGAVVIATLLFILTNRLAQTVVLVCCFVMTTVAALAVIHALGHSLTPLSLCLPLMVCVIAISDGLHIFAIWNTELEGGANHGQALRATIHKTYLPCLLASLTSAIGFGAFFISELTPLKNFGIDAFAAILLCYPLLIISIVSTLALFPHVLHKSKAVPGAKILTCFMHIAMHCVWHKNKTLSAFCVVTVIVTAALANAHVETNFLDVFFKPSSAIQTAFATADQKLNGSGSVDIIISNTPGRFRELAYFNQTRQLTRNLNTHPFINDAHSYLVPLSMVHPALSANDGDDNKRENNISGDNNRAIKKKTNATTTLPQSTQELAQELFFLDLSRGEQDKDLLSPYLNFDSSSARIEVQTPNLNSVHLASALVFIERAVTQSFRDARTIVTGSGVYIHRLSDYVVSTQVRSLALTLTVMGILFVLCFGLRLGLAGFTANLFPVLFCVGLISVTATSFDFATILVAGVTLGLAVDDSIHFLHHYRRLAKSRVKTLCDEHATTRDEPSSANDAQTLIKNSLAIVTRPVVWTSLLFCTAVLVFTASSLVVMIKFALFTVIGLFAAILSSLILLPALVATLYRHASGPRHAST